jgi:hypothetical protein
LTEKRVFNKTLNHIFKNLLFIFQIRSVARDERGLTSELGRPFGRAEEVVAVATLIKGGYVEECNINNNNNNINNNNNNNAPSKGNRVLSARRTLPLFWQPFSPSKPC